jgi:hypothetical protein
MLGLPGGMGRHAVGQTAGSGVRKIGTSAPASGPDAMGAGFTRRPSGCDRRRGRRTGVVLQWSGLFGLRSIDRKFDAYHATLAPNYFARFANK